MRTCYTLFLSAALTIALSFSVQAQVDYDMIADVDDLMGDGVFADIEIDCMDSWFPELEGAGQVDPVFIYYNSATGDLAGYDPAGFFAGGAAAFIIEDSKTLDGSIGLRATCRAMAVTEFGDIYMSIEAGKDDVEMIYRSNVNVAFAGGGGSVIAEADGTTGIDVVPLLLLEGCPAASGVCDQVFLAISRFRSAISMYEDGFYELVIPEGASGPLPYVVSEIYTDADLDLLDLFAGPDFLASVSSEFAGGEFQNVAVVLIPAGKGGAELIIIWEPIVDGTFTNPTDGGIEDIELIFPCPPTLLGCAPTVYVYNNSFSAEDGEQWGAAFFGGDGAWSESAGGGPPSVRFAEQTPMINDPDVTIAEYTGTEGTSMSALSDGTIYVASSSSFGGADAIIVMRGVPIPVELVSFNAVVDGETVTLNWETASETNNAGFEVQTLRGEIWDALGFVEGNGTTTEAQQYSFSTDMLPGTYSFRLKQIDYDGQFEYFGGVEATVGTPSTHLLSAVYPNPFNPQASFDLAVAQTQHVSVELYNVLGQRVATLFNATMEADANQTFTIDGAGLATGQYVVRVTGERFAESRTVTLLK